MRYGSLIYETKSSLSRPFGPNPFPMGDELAGPQDSPVQAVHACA
jgi:hypothetical protein